MFFLTTFSQQLSDLLPKVKTEEFVVCLVKMLKELVPTDNVMIIAYPRKNLPRVEYNDRPKNHPSTAEQYEKGAFLLDPYYLAAAKQKKYGFFHLSDLAPEGFNESEYNRIYYKYCGVIDECGYLFPFGDDGKSFVNISIGRTNKIVTFCEENLMNLTAIAPLIEFLVKSHWQVDSTENENHPDLRQQLETALEFFGSSILTERENQMVQMILHGYSSKGIAERFSISIETVKLHRKNAYAKLDLGTQGELFNLFLNSLMNIKNYESGDPLVNYHSVSKSSALEDLK